MVRNPSKNTLLVVFLLFIVALLYANTLNNGFVYDDMAVVVRNGFIRDMDNLKHLFSPEYFARSGIGQMTNSGEGSWRPLVTFSYFIDYRIGGTKSTGYHLTNLFWHGAVVVGWLALLLHTRRALRNGMGIPLALFAHVLLAGYLVGFAGTIQSVITGLVSGSGVAMVMGFLFAALFIGLMILCRRGERYIAQQCIREHLLRRMGIAAPAPDP